MRNNALLLLAEGAALGNLGSDAIKAGATAAKDAVVGMLHGDGKHAAGRELPPADSEGPQSES